MTNRAEPKYSFVDPKDQEADKEGYLYLYICRNDRAASSMAIKIYFDDYGQRVMIPKKIF